MKYCTPTRATIIARQQRDAELANRPANDRQMAALIAKTEANQKEALERRLNTVPIHHWIGIKLARMGLARIDFTSTTVQADIEPPPVSTPILVSNWPMPATQSTRITHNERIKL